MHGECYLLESIATQRYILTQVAWADFSVFMDDFWKEHPFQEVSLDYFLDAFQAKFDWDLREYIPQWLHERGVPEVTCTKFSYAKNSDGGFRETICTF